MTLDSFNRKYAGKLIDGWTGKIFLRRQVGSSYELHLNAECQQKFTVADDVIDCTGLPSSSSVRASDATKCKSRYPPLMRLWVIITQSRLLSASNFDLDMNIAHVHVHVHVCTVMYVHVLFTAVHLHDALVAVVL